jgi:hypothetical protein
MSETRFDICQMTDRTHLTNIGPYRTHRLYKGEDIIGCNTCI